MRLKDAMCVILASAGANSSRPRSFELIVAEVERRQLADNLESGRQRHRPRGTDAINCMRCRAHSTSSSQFAGGPQHNTVLRMRSHGGTPEMPSPSSMSSMTAKACVHPRSSDVNCVIVASAGANNVMPPDLR